MKITRGGEEVKKKLKMKPYFKLEASYKDLQKSPSV